MNIKRIHAPNAEIAVVDSREILIRTVQDALDIMATIHYEHACDAIIFYKEAFPEAFFDLKTGLAGEILQKFATYQMKFAVIGDFNGYKSKALQDFIRESNRGSSVFFLSTEQEAVAALQK